MDRPLVELHSHLYGCFLEEDLEWLASRRPPRWDYFVRSFESVYGRKPELDGLFQSDAVSRKRLRNYFQFTKPASFAEFQVCFDFVIACSHLDVEELAGAARRITERQEESHAEYRMLFPPSKTESEFVESMFALCEGFQHPRKAARLVVSLNREDKRCATEYEWVREFQVRHPRQAAVFVGVDFCAKEEGYPPSAKRWFFDLLRSDNRAAPHQALACLYHVGESFTDKSVESAVRWVVEAAVHGAHRLGHAVALGVPPHLFLGKTRGEIVSERLAQVQFELEHRAALNGAGYSVDAPALQLEKEELNMMPPGHTLPVVYDDTRCGRLDAFQQWAMDEVRRTGAVIESCPTSNLRIANLQKADNHPLRRFLEADLSVALGGDDPGILDTTLAKEYEIVSEWSDVGSDEIKRMQETAVKSTSEILTGRKKVSG